MAPPSPQVGQMASSHTTGGTGGSSLTTGGTGGSSLTTGGTEQAPSCFL